MKLLDNRILVTGAPRYGCEAYRVRLGRPLGPVVLIVNASRSRGIVELRVGHVTLSGSVAW